MSGYWATYMYSSNRIASRYFVPHSFKKMKTKLSKDETISSFSVFHNNVVSLNRNLENLQTQLLREVDFILMLSEWLKQKSLMLIHKCAQHICLATYCKERFSMNSLFASSFIYSFQISALTLFLVIHTEFA